MRQMRILSALTFTLFALAAQSQETSLFVDIRDLVQIKKAPIYTHILTALQNHTSEFAPLGVSFPTAGVTARFADSRTPLTRAHQNKIYSATLTSAPSVETDSANKILSAQIPMQILFHSSEHGLVFRQVDLELGPNGSFGKVTLRKEIPANLTQFKMQIGLIGRVLYLSDASHNLAFVYPLNVGGIDEGVTRRGVYQLMTPAYGQANLPMKLRDDDATWHRDDYAVFMGYPFMRFNVGGRVRPIALHHPYQGTFSRQFRSHGCIHLRARDLIELSMLLRFGDGEIEVTSFDHHLSLPVDHPFPPNQTSYKAVKNYGTSDNPVYRKEPEVDEKGRAISGPLTVMKMKHARPPIEKIGSSN